MMPSTSDLRHLPSKRIPAQYSIRQINHRLHQKYGVRGCFLGQKRVKGQFTNNISLVCIVDKKVPTGNLSKSERIPKRFAYSCLGKDRSIQTDVVQKYGSVRTQALFNPGDRISGKNSSGSTRNATIGAFGMHATHGPVFVTAGHFGDEVDKRRLLYLRDSSTNPSVIITGRIIGDPQNIGGIDYCFVRATQDSLNQLDNLPLNAVYQPVLRSDINRRLLIVTRRGLVPTVSRGLYMNYTDPRTNKTLSGLIVTDPDTVGGDSGAALVDENFRLWGFVIGTVRFRTSAGTLRSVSIYMPAIRLLGLETITFGE